jgi:hypothetical protein
LSILAAGGRARHVGRGGGSAHFATLLFEVITYFVIAMLSLGEIPSD